MKENQWTVEQLFFLKACIFKYFSIIEFSLYSLYSLFIMLFVLKY